MTFSGSGERRNFRYVNENGLTPNLERTGLRTVYGCLELYRVVYNYLRENYRLVRKVFSFSKMGNVWFNGTLTRSGKIVFRFHWKKWDYLPNEPISLKIVLSRQLVERKVGRCLRSEFAFILSRASILRRSRDSFGNGWLQTWHGETYVYVRGKIVPNVKYFLKLI